MFHCRLHLARFALPSAKAKEGHLRPVVQGEGGVHPGLCELQTDVAAAADYREMYTRINCCDNTWTGSRQMLGRPKTTWNAVILFEFRWIRLISLMAVTLCYHKYQDWVHQS